MGATIVLAAIYLQEFRPGLIPYHLPVPDSLAARPYGHRSVGATPLGMWYGSAAFAIFLFAAMLGGRKKVRHWRIGRAETWMRAHIWLSILSIPLVLFHCGFHSGSAMTTGLLILYALVMVSGFYGLALQQFIPRQMMTRLTHEVIFDQIPYLRGKLVEDAKRLREELRISGGRDSGGGVAVAVAEDPRTVEARQAVRELLEAEVMPYLQSRSGLFARKGARRRLGSPQVAAHLFHMVRLGAGERYEERVDEMERWCEQRRQMDYQEVMQHWLHYWLLVHVPASLLLLIWTAWHAVTGLFYF